MPSYVRAGIRKCARIRALSNWKPELISQTEEINEGDSIKIKRDQKLWNGFFKQGE